MTITRAIAIGAVLGACSVVPTDGYRVRRVSGPVAAYCTTEGPCADPCGDRAGCSCTCWVDGLADSVHREIVLSDVPQSDIREVFAHEQCHARGGDEQQCRR